MIGLQHQQVVPRPPISQQIHLWILDLERHRPETFGAEVLILDDEEKKRAAEFRREQDRQQYCLTRTAVRNVLSSYFRDIEPARWRFSKNPHGKPNIASPGTSGPLYFNVSHSGRWVAIAISASESMGVDVEFISAERSMLAIARRYFCQLEYSSLCSLSPGERTIRFYELWTLKEAYSKACGGALVPALRQLEISFPQVDRVVVQAPSDIATAHDFAGWAFCLFELEHYLLAMALRDGAGGDGIDSTVWEIDNPLLVGAAHLTELSPIRCSAI